MENDTISPLRDITARSSKSLLSRILEVQKAAVKQDKMLLNLFVQIGTATASDTPVGSRIELNHHHVDDKKTHIAVSCPWFIPGHETTSGRFNMARKVPGGMLMPQDVVLDRIINFKACNPEYRDAPIWIDKLCVNQDVCDEKDMSVHSMDLIYQYCGLALGLLFVELTSITQITHLKDLLEGKFAQIIADGLELRKDIAEALPVLDVIELILRDNWWHRAWIFQEEYLASVNMKLLIPCSVDRSSIFVEPGGVNFGNTTGEIEMSAFNFRTATTTLCLAFSRLGDRAVQDRCSEILKFSRRYTTLFRAKNPTGPGSAAHAMSPLIFEDIGYRNITVPSDVLAIAANCCRYTTRLHIKPLEKFERSLSVATLTLCLLNGEILRHDTKLPDIMAKTVFECLQSEKLKVPSPIQSNELSFIKQCRLSPLGLTKGGIVVEGFVCELDVSMKVKITASMANKYRDNSRPEEYDRLNEAEIELLRVLEKRLASGRFSSLGLELKLFLDRQKESLSVAPEKRGFLYWGTEHFRIIMAKGVCRAIAEHRWLLIGRPYYQDTSKPANYYAGIFVSQAPHKKGAHMPVKYAYTCVKGDRENFTKDGKEWSRTNFRFASLEIDPATVSRSRILTKRWITGLCFYKNQLQPHRWKVLWPRWLATAS